LAFGQEDAILMKERINKGCKKKTSASDGGVEETRGAERREGGTAEGE